MMKKEFGILFMVAALFAGGCHRSLDFGYIFVVADAAVADSATSDTAVTNTSNDAQVEPRRPWYVQDQAYAGPELRLPPPTGVELSGDQQTWLRGVSVSVAEDGHLLVAANGYRLFGGSRIYSLAQGSPPVLETPTGVSVANQFFKVLQGRRIIFDPEGASDTVFQTIAAGSPWAAQRSVFASPGVISNPGRLGDSRTIESDNRLGENLVVLQNNVLTPSGTQTFHVLVRVAADGTEELENRNPATWVYEEPLLSSHPAQIVGGDRWYMVSQRQNDDRSGLEIQVQPLSSDFGTPRVRTGSSPWQTPLLRAEPPVGDHCERLDAVAGGSYVGMYCLAAMNQVGRRYRHFIRIGIPETSTWVTEWVEIDDPAFGNVTSMVWDPNRQTFVLALGSALGYSTEPQDITRFYRIGLDGSLVAPAVTRPISSAVLVVWQNQLWAVGSDHRLGLFVFQPFAPNAADLRLPIPGWQRLVNVVRQERGTGVPNILVAWTDAAQTFVSKVGAQERLAVESVRALSVPWSNIVLGDSSVFVTRAVAGSPLFQTGISRLNADTLAIEATRVFDFDTRLRTTLMDVAGNQPFALKSYMGGFSQVALFSSDLEPVLSGATGTNLLGPSVCRSNSCALAELSATHTAGARVLEVGTTTARVRPWQIEDRGRYECPHSLHELSVRNADGVCTPTPFTLAVGVAYGCDAEPGLSCSPTPQDFFQTDSHTVVLEAQKRGTANAQYFLRVFARGSTAPVESLRLGAASLTVDGEIRLLQIQGGLVALVYERPNPLNYRGEVFARLAYLPSLDAPMN